MRKIPSVALLSCMAVAVSAAPPEPPPMTFFITSVGLGDGANLGGLAGADKHCQQLAEAAGSKGLTWRAYLSANDPTVNARDRIGAGPWHNAKGALIANDLAMLNGDTLQLARAGNLVNKMTALDEKGQPVNSVGDPPPLHHDILTGSQDDGRAFTDGADHTCKNWTSNGQGADQGAAQVGHHDRTGRSISWLNAHPSNGCGQKELAATGGGGLFYCFASRPVQ